MTELLERALTELSKLPPPEQDEAAKWLLAELEDEGRWRNSLSTSLWTLDALADEALAEHEAGLTWPLDPAKL